MCAFHEEALQVKHIQEDYSSESAAGRVYEQVAICSNRLSVTGTMLHLCARVFIIRIRKNASARPIYCGQSPKERMEINNIHKERSAPDCPGSRILSGPRRRNKGKVDWMTLGWPPAAAAAAPLPPGITMMACGQEKGGRTIIRMQKQ